jgi:hypothetical protein
MQPIIAREVEVIGRVCGVLRVLKH